MSIHNKKPKKPKTTTINSDENLHLEIANFASSLGLSSSLPSSGFNDTSFRNPKPKNPNSKSTQKNTKNEIKPNKSQQSNIPNNPRKKPFNAADSIKNAQNPNFENSKESKNQPKPKSQNFFAVDNSRSFDKYKNLPKLPLMKASALGVWYTDAAELEGKVIGDKKKGIKGVEEWKELVEKKRELGERLLWQFVSDYEGTRAQSGDIKMVLATQRSGTVTDKESKNQPKPKSQNFFAVDNSRSFDKYKNLPKLPLMKASALGVWYTDAAELEGKVIGDKKKGIKGVEEWKELVEKKRELGERLLWQFVSDYEGTRAQSGDIKMVLATQRSGTVTDKVSAFSVLVGDNCIANIKSIDALIGMVTSKVGKRYAFTGFEALKEMFISSLLPDRKLKTLSQQPLDLLPESKDGNSLLLLWHWEECLKQRYERYIFALEEASRDVLASLKDKSLKTIYALLLSKSEQERRLLSALVNKLGDPENKAASNASYHLTNLLSEHPNMKAVVIDEVDNFLFRPHLVLRAKYHAVNFLREIQLTKTGDGPKVAKRLLDVYFALFKVLISEAGGPNKKKKSKEEYKRPVTKLPKDKNVKSEADSYVEMDARILKALLNGINRAFGFVSNNEADDVVESQTPMLFQLAHSKNFNVGVQALMLIFKISSKNQIVSDRFYRALYSKLLLPSAMNISNEMFIGLLTQAMKDDPNLKRVAAFAKRLLQVSLQQQPQYTCACIFLLSEVLKSKPPLWNMVLQNELADEELEHFEDVVEEPDTEANKTADKPESDGVDDDDDPSEDEAGSPVPSSDDEFSDKGDDDLLGFNSLTNLDDSQKSSGHAVKNAKSSLPGGYDPRHREPIYCNADRVGWWELMVLASHVHPSVSTMAKTLLSGANIVYNGNPLIDLSLGTFLDKFMEKKPKARNWHGGSQIEPVKQLDMSKQLIGADILQLDEMDVAPEDLVFHKFFMNKMNASKKPKKKKKKGADEEAVEDFMGDDDMEEDESDNEEIDAILDSTKSALDSDAEYDYDDLDQLADDDDDELVGDGSDDGMEFPADMDDDDDDEVADDKASDDDVSIGDADDGSEDEEDVFEVQPKKRKLRGKSGASPFASLEDYEHLMDDNENEDEDDNDDVKDSKKHKKSKKTKRSKHEDDNDDDKDSKKHKKSKKTKRSKSKKKVSKE
ncbi:CCAAT-binding factor [Artemisia annua]|uniref:CCAAT-binding factor n=1 Tax=Artemisia annua TaxID=35608 RepID=A0A2U1QE12_ARTAN|nr:CCAAT-binding factor [Artemisia annua]